MTEFMDAVVNVLWMETVIFQGEEESARCCAEDVIFTGKIESRIVNKPATVSPYYRVSFRNAN